MILGSHLCVNCETRPIENSDTGLCATCGHLSRKAEKKALEPEKKRKAIPKRSGKKVAEDTEYLKRKYVFMVGKICPVYPHLPVKDIHHKRGRVGDLKMDEINWLAVSRKGHMKIELNPKWAREMGYSLPRQ